MKVRAALFCVFFAGGNVALAAEVAKTLELTGGTVPTATIVSAKVGGTDPIKSADGKQEIAKGSTISGRLVGGMLTSGKASAWKVDGKNLVDTALTGAAIKKSILTDVKVKGGDGKESAQAGVYADVELTEASLSEAKVVDASISASAVEGEKKVTTEAANVPLAGDWFRFNTRVDDIRDTDPARRSAGAVGLTAPKGTCFRVTTEVEEGEGTNKRRYARGTFKSQGGLWALVPPWGCELPPRALKDKAQCEGRGWRWDEGKKSCEPRSEDAIGARIDPEGPYDIPVEMLNERDRYRLGWTYGVLVAPFKYYRDSQTFNAGATVGPYLGYRVFDRQGSATILGFGIGATSAVIKEKNANGNETDSTKTGLSMALALLIEFKNSFNVGLMIGRDYFSKSDTVPNSGKNWIGVSFGMKIN